MRLFSFRGRVGRVGYAFGFAGAYAVIMGAALLAAVGAHSLDPSFPTKHIPVALARIQLPQTIAVSSCAIGIVALLAAMVFTLSIDVRRFHDCNISGWFVPLWFVILAFLPDRDVGDYLPSLSALIWSAVLITVPGTHGPNRYGVAPGAVPPEAS